MTDELPEIFEHLKSPPAPPELRPRVLAAVDRELARRRKPRWERALERAVTACLLLGIGWNVWQWRADDRWQARVYGPRPPVAGSQDLFEALASITHPATAQMLADRLVSVRLPRAGHHRPRDEQYERLLKEFTNSKPGPML